MRRISKISIFTAIAVLGAFLKLPSPTGTVALDSAPGFFTVIAWGYLEGAIVLAAGHIISSGIVGFPLGILHFPIAIIMIITGILFRLFVKKLPKKYKVNQIAGAAVAGTFNGLAGIMLSPVLGWGMAIALTPSLLIASFVNLAVALAVYNVLKGTKTIGI